MLGHSVLTVLKQIKHDHAMLALPDVPTELGKWASLRRARRRTGNADNHKQMANTELRHLYGDARDGAGMLSLAA
jgi:hypothetical protein